MRGLLGRPWLQDIARLGSSSLTYHVLYLLRGVVAARVLGPDLMGIWAAGFLLNMYLTMSHLGSLSAMRRDMTIARGAGDEAKVEALARGGATLALVPALLGACAVTVWVFLSWAALTPTYCWVLLLVAFLSVLQQVGVFYSFCLYVEDRFAAACRSNNVTAVLLVVTIPLIWWFGLAGLAAGFVLSQAVGLWLLARSAPYPLRPSFDWRHLLKLLWEGVPFLIVNILYTAQMSIDRLVILEYYEARGLGLYSVALQAAAIVNVLLGAASQVVYSRMMFDYGRLQDTQAVYTLYLRWTTMLCWAIMPLLVLGYFLVTPVIELVLPNYVEAMPAVRMTCLYAFLLCLPSVPSSFLTTIRRNRHTIAAQVVAVALTWGLCLASVHLGLGLVGIALANAAATLVYAVQLSLTASRFARQPFPEFLASWGGWLIPLLLGCVLVGAIAWALESPGLASGTLVVLCIALTTTAAWRAARKVLACLDAGPSASVPLTP